MPSFELEFLTELKTALVVAGHEDLAAQVSCLRVHEFLEGSRRPDSQFIYVVPKASLPEGELPMIILGGVPGLFCLLLWHGRIAVVETLGRDVLRDG